MRSASEPPRPSIPRCRSDQAVSRKRSPKWVVSGLPDVLYSDHGSDFTSTRIEQVCVDLHVRLIHSRVAVPQGRGKIERFYRTITTVAAASAGSIPHVRGAPGSEPTLTLHQLDDVLERFIVDEYNERPHSATGEAPHARWRSESFIPRMPAHPEDLDSLLLTAAATRRVQRDGIRFASTRYISPVLAAYVGEDVTVRIRPPRPRRGARVPRQRILVSCDRTRERSSETVSFTDLQTARNKQRRALKQQLRELTAHAGSLPEDTRHRPEVAPVPESAPDRATPPPARHGLRTYAND